MALSYKSYNNKIKNNYNYKKNNTTYQMSQENPKEDIRIETEHNKRNLTIIKEDDKFKKSFNFNYFRHYLKNTISTKNKMVLKKQEENTTSITNQNNEKTFKRNPSNSMKKKRYSFVNRNYLTKFYKFSKTKENENIYGYLKTEDNRKSTPLGNKKNTLTISNFDNISNTNNITNNNNKIFNGKIDDYLITKELGKGSYATVKLAINKNNKNKYAIKIYSKEILIDPQKRSTVNNEINILKQLDNVNVVKLYEVIDTHQYLYLAMEYINGISLLETIKQDKKHYFEESRAIKIFKQIVKGIIYCQSKNICHRDEIRKYFIN